MPRRPRSILPNIPAHIVQRGNDRRACFLQYRDYRSYIAALSEMSSHYGVSIHAFVLMTNHVHMLATPPADDSISRMMQQLGRKYVSYFNKVHERSGTLWEGRFRSSAVVSLRYLFACYRYIEMNPVRAGIAASPHEYPWSSYRVNALGREDRLITPHPEWRALGSSTSDRCRRYRSMFDTTRVEYEDDIRCALNKGRALE